MTMLSNTPTANRTPSCPCCGHSFGSKDVTNTGPHGGRLPLLLQCGHALCEGCVTKLALKQTNLVVCSLCQTPMSLKPEGVRSLPVDAYLVGLVTLCRKSTVDRIKTSTIHFHVDGTNSGSARKKEKSAKKEMCVECGTRAATCSCHKCESIMCGTCFEKVHKASKSLRKHQASPLITSDLGGVFPTICLQHDGRPIEYFCEDDQTPICSHCVIIGAHKKHAISNMEDKNKKALIELEPALEVSNNVLRRMKRSEKLLSASVPTAPGLNKVIDDITQQFRQAHGLLQSRESQLLEEFHSKYEVNACLEDMRSKLLADMWGLDQAVKEANRMLQVGSQMTINAQALLAKLKQSSSLPSVAMKLSSDDIPNEPLSCTFQDNLAELISMYGNLHGQTHVGLSLKSIDEIPSELTLDDDDRRIFDPPLSSAISDTASTATETTLDSDNDDSVSQTSEATSLSSKTSKTSAKVKLPRQNRVRIRPLKMELVYVTHIKNPCCFMVQRCSDFDRLKLLQRKIAKYCTNPDSVQEIPQQVDVGDFVLSEFKKTWYRARITKVIDPDHAAEPVVVEVFYIDYGNSDSVPLDRLRNIKQMFMKVPQLSKTCSLQSIVPATPNGEWPQDAINSFARMSGDKPMQMTVMTEDDDMMYVDLSKPGADNMEDDRAVSVRDTLVFMELACFTSPMSVPMSPGGMIAKPSKFFYRPSIPYKGTTTTALVSFVESPDKMYIQLVGDEARYLHQMMTEMQSFYSQDSGDLYTIFCPQKDMVCVSQFTDDNAWYRAVVIELPGRRNVRVKYVDYGNEEIVSHWKLKKIQDKHLILPMQAIHCKLADVEPRSKKSGWSSEAKQELSANACFQRVSIEVKDTSDEGVIAVVMTEVLELEQVGKRKAVCYNEWIVSVGEATSTGPGYRTNKHSRKKHWSVPRPPSPEELPIVEPSSKPRISKRSSTPQQVANCAEISSAFLTPAHTPTAPVPKASTPPPEPAANEKPPYQEVKVSHIENPGEMYMHLADTEVQRQRMMSEMNDVLERTCESPAAGDWKLDDSCAIKYSKDAQWYRGKIVTLPHKEVVKVWLVDFGFHDNVPPCDLRYLPDEFKQQPEFVFRCHIADLQPAGDITRWSRTATEFIIETLKDQICYVITKGAIEDGSIGVDLLKEELIKGDALSGNQVNYISVGKLIQEKGLALPKRLKKKFTAHEHGQIVLPGLSGTPTSIKSASAREVTACTVTKPSSTKSAAAREITACTVTEPSSTKSTAAREVTACTVTEPSSTKSTAAREITECTVTKPSSTKSAAGQGITESTVTKLSSTKSTAAREITECTVTEPSSTKSAAAREVTACTVTEPSSTKSAAAREVRACTVTEPTASENMCEQTTTARTEEAIEPLPETRGAEGSMSALDESKTEQIADSTVTELTAADTECLHEDLVEGTTLVCNADDASQLKEEARPASGSSSPPPLVQPSLEPAPAPPCELLDYQCAEIPSSMTITVVPTYVDYDCHVFVQEVKPDDDPEGRLGHFLKESTIEVKLQNAYFEKMNLRRAKIIRDGNCLFRACAQALFWSQDQYKTVRQGVVDTFNEYWFLFEGLIFDMTKSEYISRMAQDATYGGELEIQAICFTYRVQIVLYMGGLHSPISVRTYGNSMEATITLSYVSDGAYDCGHYDIIVQSQQEYDSVNVVYNKWRADKVQEFQMSERYFNNNKYEQSLLEQLMTYLQSKYADSVPNPHATYQVGQAVVAQYTDDNQFYRGKILDITPQGYKVLYVDFGNFQVMPPTLLRDTVELADIPIQCHQCVIDRILPISEDGYTTQWKIPVLNKIHELLVGKTCTLLVKDILDGPTLIVDIEMETGHNITQILRTMGLADQSGLTFDDVPEHESMLPLTSSPGHDTSTDCLPTSKPSTSDSPTRVDYIQSYGIPQRRVPSPYTQPKALAEADVLVAQVTQVDYPNLVYLQYQKQEDADEPNLVAINNQLDHLLEVSAILQLKAASFSPLKDIKPGLACVAQYSLDGCYYRAEVLSIGHDPDNYCGIIFVDYGSSEYLPSSRLLNIPEELMELPMQAFRCLLSGLEPPVVGEPGSWDPNITLKMTQLLAPQTLVAVVRSTQLELEVDLFPQNQFHAIGLDADLAYAPLIEEGMVRYNILDPENTAIIEETYEEDVDDEGPGDTVC